MAYADLIPVLAPDLVGNPGWPIAIELAEEELAPDHCYHDRVVVLLAAHILTLANRGGSGGGGPVKSMSEGGLSISFGDSGSKSALGATPYGSEVLRLNYLCYGMTARTAWIRDTPVRTSVSPWRDKPIQVGD